jgi:hypothetical protein
MWAGVIPVVDAAAGPRKYPSSKCPDGVSYKSAPVYDIEQRRCTSTSPALETGACFDPTADPEVCGVSSGAEATCESVVVLPCWRVVSVLVATTVVSVLVAITSAIVLVASVVCSGVVVDSGLSTGAEDVAST